MKPIVCGISMALALCTTLAPAQDKPGLVAAEAIETVLTVRGVNYAERTVTFQTPEGDVETIRVPDEAQNLDQVYAGAKFKMLYVQSVVIGVTDAGGQPTAAEVDRVELAPKGATPGGTMVSVKEVTAKVEGISYAERWVSIRGPLGGLRKLAVGPEVARFDSVQVGDTVVLRYTEAIGLKMLKQ